MPCSRTSAFHASTASPCSSTCRAAVRASSRSSGVEVEKRPAAAAATAVDDPHPALTHRRRVRPTGRRPARCRAAACVTVVRLDQEDAWCAGRPDLAVLAENELVPAARAAPAGSPADRPRGSARASQTASGSSSNVRTSCTRSWPVSTTRVTRQHVLVTARIPENVARRPRRVHPAASGPRAMHSPRRRFVPDRRRSRHTDRNR